MKRVIGLGLCAILGGCGGSGTNGTNGTNGGSEGAAATVVDAPEPTSQTSAALRRLQVTTGAEWSLFAGANGVGVRHLEGRTQPLIKDGITAEAATIGFLQQHRDLFAMVDAAHELTLQKVQTTPELGLQHARFQQATHGIEVWGRGLIAHYDGTGALTSISSTYAPGLDTLSLEPTVVEGDALAVAAVDAAAEHEGFDPAKVSEPTRIKLVVYVDDAGLARLAWHVEMFFVRVEGSPSAMPVRMIDALTGNVLLAYDNLQTASVEVTSAGTNVSRKIRVLQQSANWVLVDDTRTAGKVSTRNANYATSTNTSLPLVSSTTQDSGYDPAGVDAQFGAEVVYDFYKNNFNRESWDNAGGALNSYIHMGDAQATTTAGRKQLNNAFWDGKAMNYGDGDGKILTKLSAGLDVCAHELTHGVTSAESGLQYQSESGAMNESMSDIFGTLVEHQVNPDLTRNAEIGEDVVAPGFGKAALRFMDVPGNGSPAQPATYKGKNWYTGTQDNGGVHYNSGVPNNAFWIMTTAQKNPDSNIGPSTAISWANSAKLWYSLNTTYLQSSSKMADEATAATTAAKALNFSQADQNIVECAFIAVGILKGTCKDTTGGSSTGAGGGTDAGTGGVDSGTGGGVDSGTGGGVDSGTGGGVDSGTGGGVDAGTGGGVDSGTGGVTRDAGTGIGNGNGNDAGKPPGASTDAGNDNGFTAPADPSGCGCKTAGSSAPGGTLPAAAGGGLLGLAMIRRRRKH